MFKILIYVFFVFISTISFGQKKNNKINVEKSKLFFKQAEEYKQGALIQLSLYDSAIFYNPYDSEIYFKKSIWYKKTGRFIESFILLNKAVEIDPVDHLGYRAWSKLYYLHDYYGCIKDIERLDSLTPNFVDYPWAESMYYLLGICYMELENYKLATDFFELDIKENTVGNEPFYTLHYKAICFYFIGDIKKAIKLFNKSLSIYDKLPDTHYYLSLCAIKEKDFKNANIEITRCDELFKSNYKFSLPFIEPQKTIYQNDIDAVILKLK